ncbi:hypothetical protein [Chondromyces apiculatus]|uniref:Outer membrane protein beta-barrel domain-containing protein n=1 Tax=Chondromyces apiculatus DSM 436 TaxID=1192034 RepID=A0A017SVF9_9BACT|nr:hypothetical protein [Chondromyces apiculatus]EYF00296.1 Hypothetical protein CAP_0986 [Chondromyces apiculatus DSM 436]
MMRIRNVLLSTFAAAGVALLSAAPAEAFERQWHAGAGFGYAMLADPGTFPGFGGRLHVAYGLTDAINALAEVDMATHPGGQFFVFGASTGATYVVDILQWVPYVGLTLGAYDLVRTGECGGGEGNVPCHDGRFAIGVPFGLDYAITRDFAIGVAGKYAILLPSTEFPTSYFTAYARAEFLWGY